MPHAAASSDDDAESEVVEHNDDSDSDEDEIDSDEIAGAFHFFLDNRIALGFRVCTWRDAEDGVFRSAPFRYRSIISKFNACFGLIDQYRARKIKRRAAQSSAQEDARFAMHPVLSISLGVCAVICLTFRIFCFLLHFGAHRQRAGL